MIYIGFLIIIGIAWIIQKGDEKRASRSIEKCEEVHQKMYDLIDEYYGDSPAHAREQKAYTDTFIHGVWRESGRKYSTSTVKEVTTQKERRERTKALENGTYELCKANALGKGLLLDAIDNAEAQMILDSRKAAENSGGIDTIAKRLISCGMDADEAKATAEKSYRLVKGMV